MPKIEKDLKGFQITQKQVLQINRNTNRGKKVQQKANKTFCERADMSYLVLESVSGWKPTCTSLWSQKRFHGIKKTKQRKQ